MWSWAGCTPSSKNQDQCNKQEDREPSDSDIAYDRRDERDVAAQDVTQGPDHQRPPEPADGAEQLEPPEGHACHAGEHRSPRSQAEDEPGDEHCLVAMAREELVKHVVFISIVGMEGVAYPYYRTKLAAEAVVEENIIPWSILRATQFHSHMETFLGIFSKPPMLAAVPFAWQFQPVDPREVATRLAQVVTQEPAGRLPDFGGPDVRDFKGIAESWLKARKLSKRLVNLPLPLKFSRQFAEGRLLCPDHKDGKITFEQYLADMYPNE